MRLASAFIIIAILFAVPVVKAATLSRSITLNWEEVPDSTGYELELTRTLSKGQKSKPLKFKTKKNTWTGKILPGEYTMRLRSLDDRGVPGEWSEPSTVVVRLPETTLLAPTEKATLQTSSDKDQEVVFQWAPVPGASRYKVEIFGEDGSPVHAAEVGNTSWRYSLPVARMYKWAVTPISPENIPGDPVTSPFSFTLVGKALEAPVVEQPDSRFADKISWSTPEHAETFDYILSRKDAQGRWRVVARKNDVKENFVVIDPKSPGGTFRLQVRSKSKLRHVSTVGSLEFHLHEGDRSPAAIETLKMKESIEKEKDHYFIATYFLSNLSYQGQNKEIGGSVRYSALSGTGRLGYGYMPKGEWGFIGSVDVSGVILNERNYIFAAGEATAVWRTYIDDLTQFRAIGGLAFNEIPEAKGIANDQITVSNIGQVGQVIGVQLWRPFTYRLGLQLNAKAQMAFFRLSTPNNEDIVPTLSYQVGAMASYRLKPDLIGFAGIAYKQDRASYKARPYKGGTDPIFSKPGDENSVTMTGTYLNLLLEWGF